MTPRHHDAEAACFPLPLLVPAPLAPRFRPPPHDCAQEPAPLAEPGRYEPWARAWARYRPLMG